MSRPPALDVRRCVHYAYMVPPRPIPLACGPLKPQHLLVLVALADGPVHGYEIKKAVEEGGIALDPGSLYRLIARLVDEQLIARAAEPDEDGAADPRRRYYELTPLGKRVLRAETDRLAGFVDRVRAIRGLYPSRRKT
jgi:DNA-binding PadR family transcriptional regulator